MFEKQSRTIFVFVELTLINVLIYVLINVSKQSASVFNFRRTHVNYIVTW